MTYEFYRQQDFLKKEFMVKFTSGRLDWSGFLSSSMLIVMFENFLVVNVEDSMVA